ncbi:MAG: hypothetical protein ABI353_14390 [Isosphaeraceae bacterium]
MIHNRNRGALAGPTLALALLFAIGTSIADAGPRWGRRGRAVVPTSTVRPPDAAPTPMLGTFYPEPYMFVRGNGSVGGGYSPLGSYLEGNLALYGPISPLRATAAPVVTYSRGYDGVVRPQAGTSFSTPNLPELTPVIYPTRANLYGGTRTTKTPPWWPSAINFIDQN